jgi:hypothetical protein
MFEIKCPKCEANIKGLLWDYVQWRSDRRKCPGCGAQLEISNPIFCCGLCGLIFGIIIGSSHYWNFGNACPPCLRREWIRLVIAILICWMALPIIVRTTGRWQALPSNQTIAIRLKKWSQIIPISLAALAIALSITYSTIRITFLVLYK